MPTHAFAAALLPHRRQRRWWCVMLAAALMLAQWTIVAHACPGVASMAVAAEPTAGSPPDASALSPCMGHCEHGPQGGDHAGTPALPAIAAGAWCVVPLPSAFEPAPCPGADRARPPASAAPPIALLHCCWRI